MLPKVPARILQQSLPQKQLRAHPQHPFSQQIEIVALKITGVDAEQADAVSS